MLTWVPDMELAVVGAGLLTGGWLLGALRTLPTVAAPQPREACPPAPVSVVVPARDEAMVLPVLLRSLRALQPPPAQVIVVDDGSTDATADVAAAAGATVLTASPPPPGWTGKAWACHVGARAASAENLLFLDADTWVTPDALTRMLGLHVALGGGLVSVQPRHSVHRVYEQLSAYFNLVSMMATGAFTPRRAHTSSLAFGPCLLTSRADYVAAGGHAGARGQVLDDIHLAKAYGRHGLRVHCRGGGDAVGMRMYPNGMGQLLEGWTKNVAAGAAQSAPGPALGTALWVYAGLSVAVNTAWQVGLWAAGDRAVPVGWLVAWVAVTVQLAHLLQRVGTFRWWTAVAFPVPLLLFVGVFARSTFATAVQRRVSWRGREIQTVRRRAGRVPGSAGRHQR